MMIYLQLLLLCVFGLTATLHHDPVFITVKEGRDVLLPCSLSNKQDLETKLFDWRKVAEGGGLPIEVFEYDAGQHYNNYLPGQDKQFKGRVSHFQDELRKGNASILIKNTILADSGLYTCDFPRLQPSQTFSIWLAVVDPDGITVDEDSDVILPCSLGNKQDLKSQYFNWRKVAEEDGGLPKEVFEYDEGRHSNNGGRSPEAEFRGRVSHYQEELHKGNASILLKSSTLADSGQYTCHFPKLEPLAHMFTIRLTVAPILKPRPEIPGASPEPYMTILQTADGAVLQCVVKRANPKPRVEWRDSEGNILPAQYLNVTEREGNGFNVVLQTALTKTDRYYRCVSTQEKLHHQIQAEIYAHPKGAASKPSVTIIKTAEGSLLHCEVLGASPKPTVEWRDSEGKVLRATEEVSERGGSFDVKLQTAVTKRDTFRCVSTQAEINHSTHAEIYAYPDESNTGLIIGLVVAVVAMAILLLVGSLVVLMKKGFISQHRNKAPAPHTETSLPLNGSSTP